MMGRLCTRMNFDSIERASFALMVHPKITYRFFAAGGRIKFLKKVVDRGGLLHTSFKSYYMTISKSTENIETDLVDTLLSIKNDKFEVWKYFEERADKLSERLWSTGTWLMTVIAATITLPFVAQFISTDNRDFPIEVTRPFPVATISLFGMIFCLYSLLALRDMREHIEKNWRRSKYALIGKWEEPTWRGRKKNGWNILLVVVLLAFTTFVLLFILAVIWSVV